MSLTVVEKEESTSQRARDEPTLQQARAFCAVADAGGYTRAAEQLRLDRVAVLRRIERLAKVVNRGPLVHPGGVALTRAGKLVLPSTRRLVAAADALQSLRSEIRFCTYGVVASRVVRQCADLIEDEQTPLVLYDVDETERDGGRAAVERVGRGDLDIALMPSGFSRLGLAEERLYDWTLEILLPRRHPFARERTVRPIQIVDVPLLAPPPGTGSRLLLERAFATDGVELAVEFELHNLEVLRGLALSSTRFAAALPSDAFWPPASTKTATLATASAGVVGSSLSLYRRDLRSCAAGHDTHDSAVRAVADALIARLRTRA